MDSKQQPSTALQLVTEQNLSAAEQAELRTIVGERDSLYLDDQATIAGQLVAVIDTARRDLHRARTELKRTPEYRLVVELQTDIRRMEETLRLINQRRIGIIEAAMSGMKRKAPLYKKMLALMSSRPTAHNGDVA